MFPSLMSQEPSSPERSLWCGETARQLGLYRTTHDFDLAAVNHRLGERPVRIRTWRHGARELMLREVRL